LNISQRLSGVGEALLNPMMLKELRAGTRGARFFIVQLVVMLLFAAAILISAAALSADYAYGRERVDPSVVGRLLYIVSQCIQLGIAFLIVPAFAAGSITIERERQTYDILMSTNLRPLQIAWGKFSAALTMVGLLYLSLVPVVALTFLFGGITFRQIVANYAFLFVLSAVLCAWALSVSSSVQSTQRSVIGAYAGAVFAGVLFFLAVLALFGTGVAPHFVAGYGFVGGTAEVSGDFRGARISFDAWQTALYVYAGPLLLAALVMGLFFLRTVINLSPSFSDLSLWPRAYYVVAAVGLLALLWAAVAYDVADEAVDDRMGFLGAAASLVLLLASLSTLFACDAAVPAAHLRRKYAALPAWRRWLGPGTQAGTVFCLVTTVALAGLTFAAFLPFSHGLARGVWKGRADWWPFLGALLTILPPVVMLSGLGAGLSTVAWRWPVVPKVITAITGAAMSVLPIIHWAIWMEYEGRTRGVDMTRGPWTLALSPVIALWSAILPHESRHEFPAEIRIMGTTAGLHVVYAAVYLGLGLALHAWAQVRIRRLNAQATR
jgi:ABC-type transport system involved in multi-copper enzyme maturation permease subunit